MARNFLSFVLIVAVLASAAMVEKEIRAYLATRDAMELLKRGRDGLDRIERDIRSKREEPDERVAVLKDNAPALANRIQEIDNQIGQKSAGRDRRSGPTSCVVFGGAACDKYLDGLKVEAEIKLLEYERATLYSVKRTGDIARGEKDLERLRLAHQAIYFQYQRNQAAIEDLKQANPWWVLKNPWSRASQELRHLKQTAAYLLGQVMRADQAYRDQKKALELIKKGLASIPDLKSQIDAVFKPLNQEIVAQKTIYLENWVTKLFEAVNHVFWTAAGILLSIILTPIAIKAFYYFVIAPVASRRPAISLLPAVSGAIDGLPGGMKADSDRLKVSDVSQVLTIDHTLEILIHPEYLQSSAIHGEKDTKWLLDRSYPLSSMAAGMFGMTRIRTASTEMVVVSATRDPLSEVGVISLPEGAALVLQPHRLIGIVQRKDHPIKISRHWRLGHLNAWLTLQLRFLVFHGPATLVVQGCRGVRVEKSGNGRSVNQAATIGFSANLAYSTIRCETFGAYLMGKQELFNDSFAGGNGFYVYEEMPHGGAKTGIFGRGIEGLSDSVLKVFGI